VHPLKIFTSFCWIQKLLKLFNFRHHLIKAWLLNDTFINPKLVALALKGRVKSTHALGSFAIKKILCISFTEQQEDDERVRPILFIFSHIKKIHRLKIIQLKTTQPCSTFIKHPNICTVPPSDKLFIYPLINFVNFVQLKSTKLKTISPSKLWCELNQYWYHDKDDDN
jgi:hypothetical protein